MEKESGMVGNRRTGPMGNSGGCLSAFAGDKILRKSVSWGNSYNYSISLKTL